MSLLPNKVHHEIYKKAKTAYLHSHFLFTPNDIIKYNLQEIEPILSQCGLMATKEQIAENTKYNDEVQDIYENIVDSNGYVGINGAFRIMENGTNEHSLDIVEVTSTGLRVVDKAPAKFENKILDDSDLFDPADNFPLVFGKDANEVRAYILD